MQTPTMHYASISGGAMDEELQAAFIEAQDLSKKHHVKTSVTLEIVMAPEDAVNGFGAIQYKIGVKRGSRASAPFQTQFNEEGYIAFDSGSMRSVAPKPAPTSQIPMFDGEARATQPDNVIDFKNGTDHD